MNYTLVNSVNNITYTKVLDSENNQGGAVVLSTVLFSTSTVNYTLTSSFGRLIVCHVVNKINVNIISVVSPLCVSRMSIPRCQKQLMSLCRLTVAVNFLKTCLIGCRLILKTSTTTRSDGR